MIELANRVKKLEESATLAIAAKSKEMMKNGIDVISLAAGEPDWDPPYEAKEASINAIRDNNAHYTPTAGIPELRSLVVKKLKTENNLDVEVKNVLITSGAKFGLYIAIQALINEGDEVLVIAPYWVSYVEMIKLAGGVPRVINTDEEDGFKMDISELEKHITARVKGIIINYPSNPTGVTYTDNELKQIAEIAYKKNIFIISDEIYEYFNYGNKHTAMASLSSKYMNNIITINGFSKAYSIPGWRVGYIVANEEIINKLNEIQSHSVSNPNNIAQIACIAALKESGTYVNKMVADYLERRNYFVEALRGIHGVRCLNPDGAFYVFPNIQYYLGKDVGGEVPNNSMEFSKILLEKAHVSVVPGSAFGIEGYIRMSYTQPIPRLKEAIKRITSILS